MSGGLKVLALQKDDVTKMLAAGTHLGAANVNFQVGLLFSIFKFAKLPFIEVYLFLVCLSINFLKSFMSCSFPVSA